MRKIALITGANKGIGFETARQLGKLNYTVLLGARDENRGQAAASTLKGEDIDAFFIALDPTNASSVANAKKTVEATYGLLDVLINNAGLFLQEDSGLASQIPTQVLRDTYDINVFGLHEVVRAFWPLLIKSKAARLVNVSSGLGSLSLHADGMFPEIQAIGYNSSKAAVNMMTLHYAAIWKNTPHRANAIHPGSVKTDMNKNGELSVEEGAKTSVDLATIGADGPNGGFFHLGKRMHW